MKHRRPPRYAPLLAVAAALALAVALEPASRVGAQTPPVPNGTPAPLASPPAATPLPSGAPIPSAPLTAVPSPSPSPAPRSRGRRRGGPAPGATNSPEPAPSATPTSPAFSTLDGTWEVQLQYIDRTEYSYLIVHQTGTSEVSGTWKVNGKEYPFDGNYDGRLIRLLVKEPAGNVTMSGYVEGASDMVGQVDLGNGKGDPTPFTAEHRGSKGSIFKKNP